MNPVDLLRHAVDTLERLAIPYRIVGSMATIAYGEPRFTNDIDIVVRMQPGHVAPFCAAFPEPMYYCSPEAVDQAVRQRFQFNVLHLDSGLKLDLIIASESPFDQARFSRGRRLATAEHAEAWFASPEDVILKKLVYFQEGGSEKHLRDIVGVLKLQGDQIERGYLDAWIRQLGVESEWQLVLARMDADAPT